MLSIVLLCLWDAGAISAQADKISPVTVIYPNIREPYRSVFMEIIGGIETTLQAPVLQYVLEGDNASELKAWLDSRKSNTVIALGKQGLSAAETLPDKYRVIAGAILSPPDEAKRKINGIALTPSPELLFAQLLRFSSTVKRITLIYSEAQSGWLIPHAQKAAQSFNLVLNARQVTTLAEAATLYRDMMEKDFGKNEAIWLPQDTITVDQRTILPMVLKEAWDKQFIVFSSSPAYVKRGVLFALYPDNTGMGKSLGRMAMADHSDTIEPLADLLTAVNIRTADHLNLKISGSDLKTFDLVFPAPH